MGRQRQRPEGVPLHTTDTLLELAGLATVSRLRLDRRQPAEGQQPAACYYTGYEYALLYTAADAVAMPPLSPGRQRRWELNRTCAECGKRRQTPWERGPDGQRYCDRCHEIAAKRLWETEQAARRTASQEWARQVLADPNAVLLAEDLRSGWITQIRAETTTGDLLLDLRVRQDCTPAYLQTEDAAGSIPPAQARDQVTTALTGRRLVCWWPSEADWIAVKVGLIKRPTLASPNLALPCAKEDSYCRRWSDHVGARQTGNCTLGGSYRWFRTVREQPAPAHDPEGLLAAMRIGLATMAAGASIPREAIA